MKTNGGLFLLAVLVCAAGSLRAQDASIDLGPTDSGTLTVNDGSLTITSGTNALTAGKVNLNSDATLALGATENGGLVLTILQTAGTVLLANPSPSPLTISTSTAVALNVTGIVNNITGADTAIVTGGTLTAAPFVPVNIASGILTLNGNSVLFSSNPSAQQLIFPYAGVLQITPTNGTTYPALTAASLQMNFTAGMQFNLMPSLTDFGGLRTSVHILGGTASVNRTVLTTFSAGPAGAASDDVNFSGTITDTYVLELSYSQAAALAAPGGPEAMRLEWLNPTTSIWENAVDGNTGDSIPTFVDGAYDPATDFHLGTYGVDTATQTVWAVIDHNSQFTTQSVPEPSVWTTLCGAFASLLAMLRFRAVNRRAA